MMDMFCNITQDNIVVDCPNCEKKLIRSYPTTTCTYCQNVFQNKIKPIRKHITYKSTGRKTSGPVFFESENNTVCGIVSSIFRGQAELLKIKKRNEQTQAEYDASLIYSTECFDTPIKR